MDLLHHIYNLILDGEIHIAPIKDPQRVLDIGTGTGIWAVDFAEYETKLSKSSLLASFYSSTCWPYFALVNISPQKWSVYDAAFAFLLSLG